MTNASTTVADLPFLPMDAWDKRDEPVLLLVDYGSGGNHALDDALVAVTIGHNNDHNVGDGEGAGWEFAGWCWTHDHYTQGEGKPIGWSPLDAYHQAARDAEAAAIERHNEWLASNSTWVADVEDAA